MDDGLTEGNNARVQPTFTFLPGLHGTAELFDPLLRVLPRGLPQRIVEYPRHQALGYPAHLEFIQEKLADLSAMIVVGESFSGVLALRLAAADPKRVRAVVLVAGFVRPSVPRLLCWLGAPLALVPLPLPGVGIRCFLSGFRAPAELVRATRRAVWRVRGRVIARRILAVGNLDARQDLRSCPVPILYLAGKRDRLVGRRAVRQIGRIRPDAQIAHFDAPHLLLQVRPQEAWAAIEQFAAAL